MDMSLPLDAREVLFHLNYMGYRNINKEQLKSFMTGKLKCMKFFNINLWIKFLLDLKKLIRYESHPDATKPNQEKTDSIPLSANIERLFKSHTQTSLQKQRHKLPEKPKVQEKNTASIKPPTTDHIVQNKKIVLKETRKTTTADKENIPAISEKSDGPPKSKMWIRPKSAQTSRPISARKRTDPVALYQEYQKDWARFKDNICESSRSDLRWKIREKLSRQDYSGWFFLLQIKSAIFRLFLFISF